MTRRVWNDRALESPRVGYLMAGGGAGTVAGTAVWVLCGAIAGMPAWLYLIAGMAALYGAAFAAAGAAEIRRARAHHASMRAYGNEITASFERLLAERDHDR